MNRYSNAPPMLSGNYYPGLSHDSSMNLIQLQSGQRFAITTTFVPIQDNAQSFLRVRTYYCKVCMYLEKSIPIWRSMLWRRYGYSKAKRHSHTRCESDTLKCLDRIPFGHWERLHKGRTKWITSGSAIIITQNRWKQTIVNVRVVLE